MKRMVKIAVEGIKDFHFLHEFILRKFGGLFSREQNKLTETIKDKHRPVKLRGDGIEVSITWLTGKDNIAACVKHCKPPDSLRPDELYRFAIIFDADIPPEDGTENSSCAGIEFRPNYMLGKLNNQDDTENALNVKRQDCFFLPDDHSNGDLETIMEKMIKDDERHRHRRFIDECWNDFSNAVVKLGETQKPTRKSMMNEYSAAFNKETWEDGGINGAFQKEDLWDWDAPILNELHDFLKHLFCN